MDEGRGSTEDEGSASEAQRLERLWRGSFGDDYVDRNRSAYERRQPFWEQILKKYSAERVLEVGCNVGGNLHWISQLAPEVYGVDVNAKALSQIHTSLPKVHAVFGRARELPFRDRFFDLVFTTGVLIHQPPEVLPIVMSEVVRCSRRYVLCGEYHADEPTEIHYRGESGALFKRDFSGLYQKLFPELALREQGFLGPEQGWDNITYSVFEKKA